MEEFIVFKGSQPSVETSPEKCDWGDPSRSRRFIEMYAKYKDKLGSYEVRTRKQMWAHMAEELSKEFNMTITAGNAENRWRVLERSYRKHIENKTSPTGRKHLFEYANEMDKIFGGKCTPKKKKTIHPQLLLSSNDVRIPKVQSSLDSSYKETTTMSMNNSQNKNNKTMSVLEKMTMDRLAYQKEKLKILERLGNDRLNLIKQRNELLNERNEILKNSKCSCILDLL